MRLRLGRPDLSRYADLFHVPEASPDATVRVTFLGVASLLITDGETSLLTDGYFSRPGMARVLGGRLTTDSSRVEGVLSRAGVDRLAAVLPVHTHFDHVLDSPEVARRTGAVVMGGESAANVARGAGLGEDRIAVVTPGVEQRFGAFAVTHHESEHCPPDRYPGTISAPVRQPARATAYRCGEAWSIIVAHDSGKRALVQGSAGFVPGALAGQAADVAYLGVGQLGVQSEDYIREYWHETVRAVGARRVVLIHWDDFFRPLDEPLRALPYLGDDLDVSVRILAEEAARDGVDLAMPRVWVSEDPWSG